MTDEIRDLMVSISCAEREIAAIEKRTGLKKMRERLKEILFTQLSDTTRLVTYEHESIRAKLYFRSNSPKVDFEKMRELLHPNTYRAIVTEKEPSAVLEVRVF
jgi:hypothetical protein